MDGWEGGMQEFLTVLTDLDVFAWFGLRTKSHKCFELNLIDGAQSGSSLVPNVNSDVDDITSQMIPLCVCLHTQNCTKNHWNFSSSSLWNFPTIYFKHHLLEFGGSKPECGI